ncbi:glycosyltransferase [Clostridium grantii]|uniref:Cellulose synthase (UDP-forming) n=1 Tax=Clostridium grantii DSM 8605 TaxID=1121316 RepID=A0A1M5VTL8_9CLOT|nr:glycosyltransferase [Clostridium grantii]SHH78273.1 cellulose synthase (UDP-forming) [Clostridium grantii DSM 8605]
MGILSEVLNLDIYSIISISAIIWIFILYYLSKKSKNFKRIFIVSVMLFNIGYLIWRTLYTIPFSYGIVSFILGIILLTTEWMGFFRRILLNLINGNSISSNKKDSTKKDSKFISSVDILILAGDESIRVLKKTIAACLSIDYDKDLMNIYLCYNTNVEERKALCKELSIHELRRFNDKYGKAGTINHALINSKGEFILLLDGNMVPKASILENTLHYFNDNKIGFVQISKSFYNENPFQYNLNILSKIPNEEDYFFKNLQKHRELHSGVIHEGSNSIFSRNALKTIKNIPNESMGETVEVTMNLQSNGFKSIYTDENLVSGLKPERFIDMVKARKQEYEVRINNYRRIGFSKKSKLSFMQKIIYLEDYTSLFSGIAKLIYIIAPTIYAIFGLWIIETEPLKFLKFWIPNFIAYALWVKLASGNKKTKFWWNHVYNVAFSPFLALSALKAFFIKKKYVVDKEKKVFPKTQIEFSWEVAIPHIVLLIINITAWILFEVMYSNNSSIVKSYMIINLIWSIYNAIAIFITILVCFEKPRFRNEERVITKEQVILRLRYNESHVCEIQDISDGGCKILCRKFQGYDDKSKWQNVRLFSEKLGNLEVEIVWVKEVEGKLQYGLRFLNIDNEMLIQLMKYLA